MRLWELAGFEGGRFPIVLRRDGSQLPAGSYFVISLYDPHAAAALAAYADATDADTDPLYVQDIRDLARRSIELASQHPDECHPDRGPHRRDDPLTLRWAQEGCSLDAFANLLLDMAGAKAT